MSDGTHFYVDSGSGEVIARRTGWWRFYDFMWGLHIMDPGGREDTHNPFVIGFGLVALVTMLLAIILLPLVTRRRRKGGFPRWIEPRRQVAGEDLDRAPFAQLEAGVGVGRAGFEAELFVQGDARPG